MVFLLVIAGLRLNEMVPSPFGANARQPGAPGYGRGHGICGNGRAITSDSRMGDCTIDTSLNYRRAMGDVIGDHHLRPTVGLAHQSALLALDI